MNLLDFFTLNGIAVESPQIEALHLSVHTPHDMPEEDNTDQHLLLTGLVSELEQRGVAVKQSTLSIADRIIRRVQFPLDGDVEVTIYGPRRLDLEAQQREPLPG